MIKEGFVFLGGRSSVTSVFYEKQRILGRVLLVTTVYSWFNVG